MHPDNARALKSRILGLLGSVPSAQRAGEAPRPLRVAVGLASVGRGGVRVAVRLERESDRAALPVLGTAAEAELDVRVIGPVRPLPSPASPASATSRWSPEALQQHVRPLRPGLSVAHRAVSAGTLGGFVRTAGGLAVLSNQHVLAPDGVVAIGDPVLQPGPADHGLATDRIATLAAFVRLHPDARNLVDAAVATLAPDVLAEPGDLPGGPLSGAVVQHLEIDPDEDVEKVGRTTGHTRGRISAVEVDGVAVQYDALPPARGVRTFDDQIEIEGRGGAFSAGGDSGSVIWRARDRAPLGLLFAGSATGGRGGAGVTFASPLATVLASLGVEWVS